MHVISIAPFVTASALDSPVEFKIRKAYLETARNMLKQHNITIEQAETGLTPGLPYMLESRDPVTYGSGGNVGKLRKLCEDGNAFASSIPVIFSMFYNQTDYGITVIKGHELNEDKNWGPYILINIRLQSSTNAVLLHELIHAAYDSKAYGFTQPLHDKETNSIFYTHSKDPGDEGGQSQVWLPGKHVTALRKADFTTFKP
jgi:hypothetical protein